MVNMSEEAGFEYPQATILGFVCTGKEDVSCWQEKKKLMSIQEACKGRYYIRESWEYKAGHEDDSPAGRKYIVFWALYCRPPTSRIDS